MGWKRNEAAKKNLQPHRPWRRWHSDRAKGGGFCALNDVAIALAHVRYHGFRGTAVVLDVDAHAPDGTADCLGEDLNVWMGLPS